MIAQPNGIPAIRRSGTGRVRLAVLAGAALFFCLLALPVGPAGAGEFTFSQCGPGGQQLEGRYLRLGDADRVNVLSGCRPAADDLLGVYQNREGGTFREGEGGQYLWKAPEGLVLVGVSVRSRLKDANGLRAAVVGRAGERSQDLDGNLAHDGSVVEARWLDRSRPLDSVLTRLRCNRTAGCINQSDAVKAYFEVLGLQITVDDRRGPVLTGSGQLFESAAGGRWLAGSVGYSVRAGDAGSGIKALELRVNGYPAPVVQPRCDGLSGVRALGFSPCPSTIERSARLDTTTAPFQEGANRVEACVSDFAAPDDRPNTTCTAPVTVLVDNREPPPPLDFRTDTDGSWTATPEVGVMWDSTGDPGSGLSDVRWRLIEAATDRQVAAGSVPGTARSTTIRVPEPGEYLLETRFADLAGNVGSPAVAWVRFDDIAPPPAAPVVPGGWLSRDELPLPARVEPVDAAGPSGILGYALVGSDQGPLAPCRASICRPEEVNVLDRPGTTRPVIAGLREGANWLSAVAVSGAYVPSRDPVTSRVMVDRTHPESTLSGVAPGWSRYPVSVVVESTDALSGMVSDPDDDGRPVTVIEMDGAGTVLTDGDRAEATVTREGVTGIRFYARDLAGNVNDGKIGADGERRALPGVAQVKIDRSPPTVTFRGRPDPSRPEAVQFDLLDQVSGVVGGEVVISPVGSPQRGIEVEADLIDGRLEAEIPSDDLAPGGYEVVGWANDRAGNRGSSAPARLVLPLKIPVSVSLAAGRSGRRALAGSVRVAGEAPGRALDLVVEESFTPATGWPERRTTVRSAPDGTFQLVLPSGPARSVRVLFAGTATESRAVSRSVRILDRDQVTFAVSSRAIRNGKVLRMWGQVSGPGFGPARAGKGVVIQYFDPSRRRWRPVEVLACDEDGRFRFAYRFTTITSSQRILFRAQSSREAGWPFRPAASRKIGVVVWP